MSEARSIHELNPSRKETKRTLDREEKRLGKIADKNTSVLRSIKSKALKRKLHG